MSWSNLATKHNKTYNNQLLTEDTIIHSLVSIKNFGDEHFKKIDLVYERMEKYLREQYLKVQIFYSSMGALKTVELPKYNLESFLVKLGGAFSLYLGICVVSLFEIVEFFVRKLCNCLNRY